MANFGLSEKAATNKKFRRKEPIFRKSVTFRAMCWAGVGFLLGAVLFFSVILPSLTH
jgi:hypothetical protein